MYKFPQPDFWPANFRVARNPPAIGACAGSFVGAKGIYRQERGPDLKSAICPLLCVKVTPADIIGVVNCPFS